MADLSFRVQHVIKTEVDVTQAQLSRNSVEVLTGTASFRRPHAHPRGQRAGADRSTRPPPSSSPPAPSRPYSPKVPLNGRTIVNSDQILQMPDIPKTLIVVGGGVIGVEYTCMFATLGVRVILVEKRPRLLEFADAEMVEALSYHLRDHRVTMRLNEEVESVEETAGGSVVANLQSKKKISGDALLYAVGRQGNVDELNLAAAGIEADSRGRIPVDAEYRTSQPHIFAVGDVIGFPSLASVSMEQGRIAAAHAFGIDPAFESGLLSVRHLHHSGDFVHRKDRGAADRRRCSLRSGRGLLSRDRARPDSRRHHRPPEAHLPSRDQGIAGRAHHRRRRVRVAAHRAGGPDPQGNGGVFRGYGLQLSDAGRMLTRRRRSTA